jgi:polysaccharide export outer membrane protein
MSNNSFSPRHGTLWLALIPALLMGELQVLSQETTIDLRESAPIFRRGSSRRPVAASNSNTQATPQAPAQGTSLVRRSGPQPYANPAQDEAAATKPVAYTSSQPLNVPESTDAATSDIGASAEVGAESDVQPIRPAPGKVRRSNPDVSALLPLPNWGEGSDVPTQAPQGRMIGESPSANYVLNASDFVRILVYQEADLATETRISKDGSINFPLIGMTQIGGKTVNEAVELIRKKLDTDFLVNPQITLTVLEYSRARFTILGEVNHPGTYDIPREETVSLLDAIASAGGFTRTARTTSVTVKRKADGRESVIKIDAKQMARESTASFNILPGDTITVPTTIF